ncbi:MAG TPA: hypothetical protein VK653_14145 [Xanthobacteraceae bacterium]|jgi:hypothetical protein|nr:hypothetical protein [Xanthobacteraceae bacterium]
MTGRAVLPIVAAALFAAAGISPALAQALGPNEAHGSSANVKPNIALTASQKSAIYGAVLRQRLRSASAADIPLIVGAPVPRSAPLLALPDEAAGDEYSAQFLKYAIVEGNVVLVDSINMRVVDILHGGAGP